MSPAVQFADELDKFGSGGGDFEMSVFVFQKRPPGGGGLAPVADGGRGRFATMRRLQPSDRVADDLELFEDPLVAGACSFGFGYRGEDQVAAGGQGLGGGLFARERERLQGA